MKSVSHSTTSFCYPVGTGRYRETYMPFWDTIGKVASIATLPLQAISWCWDYVRTSREQYQKLTPPGPQSHLLLGNFPELRWSYNYNILDLLWDVNENYGKKNGICTIRLGLRNLHIVTAPKLIKEILQQHDDFTRGETFEVWQEKFSKDGLGEGKVTQENRKKAEQAIGQHTLPTYFQVMKQCAEEWVGRLSYFQRDGQSVDIMYEAERAALAMMGVTIFKSDGCHENPFGLSFEEDEKCSEFLASFHTIFKCISEQMISGIANIPYIGNKIYPYLYSKDETELTDAKDSLKKILLPIFRGILEGEINPNSHFHSLLIGFGINIKKPNYPDMLNKSLGFLQAVFETSSKAIGWVLYHLARDHELQNRLRAELLFAFGREGPSCLEDLKKVTLLNQVMEEALRLWTPFPILARDVKNPEKFKGYRVNEGDTFLITPYIAHRREENWENATEFNPEHFEPHPDKTEDMLDDKWQMLNAIYGTFLGGAHRCPGRHFAKQEILLLLTYFILNFQFELEKPSKNPVGVKWHITLQSGEAINVILSRIISDDF